MLDRAGIKHSVVEIGLDKASTVTSKRAKTSRSEPQVGTSAHKEYGDEGINGEKRALDGYAISAADADLRNFPERKTLSDRMSCLAALDRGDEFLSKSKLHRLVLRNDAESVKIILDHPKSRTSSFQSIKDLCLADSVEGLNVSMAKILLSSGASPSSNRIHKNAFKHMGNPNLGTCCPANLEAMKIVLQEAVDGRKPNEK